MAKNELKLILKLAGNVELWPLIALITFFAFYAWVDRNIK